MRITHKRLAKIEWCILQKTSKLLASFPVFVTHTLARLLQVFIFGLFGFRRKVILQNLARSFPEKTEYERSLIAQQFSRFFCELLLETIRRLSLSESQIDELYHFENREVITQLHQNGKGIALVLGHNADWELGMTVISKEIPRDVFAIYHPPKSFGFRRLLYLTRRRFGTRTIPMRGASKKIQLLAEKRKGLKRPMTLLFLGDQNAPAENARWTRFLQQDTAFFWGMERLSKKLDLAVVFMKVSRTETGKAIIRFELLFESVQSLAEGAVIDRFSQKLEAQIQEDPAHWLWSHRRWKAVKPKVDA